MIIVILKSVEDPCGSFICNGLARAPIPTALGRTPAVVVISLYIICLREEKKDDLDGMWDEKPNVLCISAEICDATGARLAQAQDFRFLKGGEGETVLDCLLPFTAKG